MNRIRPETQTALQVISEKLQPVATPNPTTVVALVVHPDNLAQVQAGAPNLPVFTDQACAIGHMFPVQFQHVAKFDQLLQAGQGPMQAWRHRKEPVATPLTKARATMLDAVAGRKK